MTKQLSKLGIQSRIRSFAQTGLAQTLFAADTEAGWQSWIVRNSSQQPTPESLERTGLTQWEQLEDAVVYELPFQLCAWRVSQDILQNIKSSGTSILHSVLAANTLIYFRNGTQHRPVCYLKILEIDNLTHNTSMPLMPDGSKVWCSKAYPVQRCGPTLQLCMQTCMQGIRTQAGSGCLAGGDCQTIRDSLCLVGKVVFVTASGFGNHPTGETGSTGFLAVCHMIACAMCKSTVPMQVC